ncbi:MAG TPA: T9SS type A sorting domain-containing protein [bacterium]|nr:T9SS type A sorting domain-containing protein [bacterium]
MTFLNNGARSGLLAFAAAALTLATGPLAGSALAADPTEASASSVSWIEEMGAYFDANPALKTTPGSGYKQYMRAKWFTEPRLVEGRLRPDLRWNAWLEKKAISAANPALRANTWFSLGPTNFAGRMLSMDFDPTDSSVIYVGGADGGVWKSTDSGVSWTPLSDELPALSVSGLAVSKTNNQVIVACTGETGGAIGVGYVGGVGILRSTDGGSTWVTTDYSISAGSNDGFHFCLSTAAGTFIAGGSDGLYRSSDDGATWVQRRGGGHWYDGQISPIDPATIWVVRGDATPGASVKVSTDDGVTWSKPGAGQPPSLNFGKSKLGVSGSTIYCAIGTTGSSAGYYGMIRSTDNGATWVDLSGVSSGVPGTTSQSQSWYNLSCAADPNNSSRVLFGLQQMYRSNDAGLNFTTVTGAQHVDMHVLMYEPGNNTVVWSGTDGGMYENTADGLAGSWIDRNSGLVTYQFYDVCTSNDGLGAYVMGGTQDNGTDRWAGTTTWTSEIGADGMVCNIGGTNSDYAYGEIQFGSHRKSTNRGLSFFTFNSGLPGGNNQWVAPVALDYNDEEHLLTHDAGPGGVYRSTNGSSWSLVSSHSATWIDISRLDGNLAYTISGQTVHVTTDNGNTWTPNPTGFSGGAGTKVLADPVDVNEVYCTFSGYSAGAHVARSTDKGSTWTDITGNLPAIPVNAIAVDPSNSDDIYIGTDLGVWFTRDNGANWYPVGDVTLPNAVVNDLEIRDADRKLVAGTFGRGAWELTIPAEIENDPTGVEVAVTPELRNLMLDRAWPNPATDRTLLRYAARSDASVSLKIYDVHGRMVSNLEEFSRGDGVIRTTPWFTDDVPSGVYFAVLQAGDVQKSQKITVIR